MQINTKVILYAVIANVIANTIFEFVIKPAAFNLTMKTD